MLDTLLAMYRMRIQGIVQLHIFFRHISQIVDILASTDTDIAIHLLHAVQVDLSPGFDPFRSRIFKHAAQDGAVSQLDKGMASGFADLLHNSFDQISFTADHLDQHIFARLHVYGIPYKVCRQLLNSWILHPALFLPLT
ncbi:hypothetical protein D3C80_1473920 [compost metagenome]